jgi:hypothetical protein
MRTLKEGWRDQGVWAMAVGYSMGCGGVYGSIPTEQREEERKEGEERGQETAE